MSGGWPGNPYAPAGWGYPPAFGFMPFVPPGPAPGLNWGGIGVRFGALVVDAVIIGVAAVIASLLSEAAGIRHYADGYDSYSSAAIAIEWIFILFAVCYHPACWYAFGGSVGQRALGLRIVRASDGGKLGLGAVLIRYLIFAVVHRHGDPRHRRGGDGQRGPIQARLARRGGQIGGRQEGLTRNATGDPPEPPPAVPATSP